MNKKSEVLADAEKVKEQLEKLSGQDLQIPADAIIRLSVPVSTFNITDGNVCSRRLFLPFPGGKFCNPASLLDVAGAGTTASDAKLIFQITDFACLGPSTFAEPVVIVVTPRADGAFFATQTHLLVNNNNDVQISVFTWNSAGKPAPNISFDWRFRAVFSPIIF
jgi:hypothetical protein